MAISMESLVEDFSPSPKTLVESGPVRDFAAERKAIVDEVARDLIAEWERVEGPVTPSYVANFADMAKAMVERFAPEPELPLFVATNQLVKCENLDSAEYHRENINSDTEDLDAANLISSQVTGTTRHRPILDLDFPAALIPSSTEGHFHLYLDKELTHDQMDRLVTTLWELGIIADGNLNQWQRSKRLFLRLPWVRKRADSTDDTPKDLGQ
jgi:hypothetical protein